MFKNKKVMVVMPAYNAARTLRDTYDEVMSQGVVDKVIVVDDASADETTKIALTLPDTVVHTHPWLRGESKDLLSTCTGGGGGYCNNGASGLSIYAEAYTGDGVTDRQRAL